MSGPSAIWNDAFRLALASASPTRRRLLEAVGLPFETVAVAVDERALEAALPSPSPAELAAALARAKALSARVPGALVLGADQVLSLDGRIFHKSATRETALATLSRLAGRTHRLTSAFALTRDGEIVAAEFDVADMTMRALDAAALERYLDAAGPGVLGSVGVYHYEGLGAHLFERVVGDHTSILGLPMLKVLAALRRLGGGNPLMIVVGLTGSLAMGKSALAAIFAELGAPVFDADSAVHEIYRGDGVAGVEAAFPGVADNGVVDREKLAKAVVGDAEALKRLEAIVHPLVAERRARFLDDARRRGARVAILDVPLLMETGGDALVDVVVVVSARPEIQRARALSRPGLDATRFEALLQRQIPDVEKRRRAHFVIDTSGTLEDSRRQAQDFLRAVVGGEGSKHA